MNTTNPKILIIDNERLPLTYYVRGLERAGYIVHLCSTTDGIADALKNIQPDVILLDVMMPPGKIYKNRDHSNGLWTGRLLYKDIRGVYPDIPIVMFTQLPYAMLAEWFPITPHLYCITKYDYSPSVLVQFIRSILTKTAHEEAITGEQGLNIIQGSDYPQEEVEALNTQGAGEVRKMEPEKPSNTELEVTKIKVLFLAANPSGSAPLKLDEEMRTIKEKIRASTHRDMIDIVSEWAVRPDDLLQFLNEYKPHIVHFSGHGSATEEIILHDNQGNPKPVSKQALRSLFRTLRDNVKVVVLNACFSKPQAEAITEHISFAIGMNRRIGDQAAITFAASFYRAVGFGRSVQEAFDQGITSLLLEDIPEEDTPELLPQKGSDASKVVLIRL